MTENTQCYLVLEVLAVTTQGNPSGVRKTSCLLTVVMAAWVSTCTFAKSMPLLRMRARYVNYNEILKTLNVYANTLSLQKI